MDPESFHGYAIARGHFPSRSRWCFGVFGGYLDRVCVTAAQPPIVLVVVLVLVLVLEGVIWCGVEHADRYRGFVVPKGLNDRSQAIYCLEHVQLRIRPVGHGLIRTQLINRPIVARQSDPITPYLRDGFSIESVPV